MEWLSELWRLLMFFLRRGRFHRELEEEMRLHQDLRAEAHAEEGMAPEEAGYAARREFGNALLLRETSRDMWGLAWLETLLQDLRFGLRQLRRNSGFTVVAALTLALGIGANMAIFSVAESVLSPPFVGTPPSRLATIYTSGARRSGYSSSSYPDYLFYREHSRAFSGIAAFVRVEAAWTHGDTTELPWAEVVSSNYFDVLGVKPLHGRFLLASENHNAGPARVAVVSHDFWRTHMDSNPDAAGRALTLNGQLFTVVGVAPKGFEGVQLDWGGPPDFWLPMSAEETFLHADLLDKPQARFCLMLGRLRPGVTMVKAASEMRLLASQLEQAYPDADQGRTALVIPFSQGRIWPTWRAKITNLLWLVEIFAGLVLLVACADVANLLLARGASRQKEIGVRLALGAGRSRVVRQLFTESLLLSLAGAGLGLFVARWTARWITTFRRLFTIHFALHPAALDGRMLAFTATLAIFAALVSGLVPAFRVSRFDLNATLKQAGSQASPGRLHQRLRHSLTVAEISLAFVAVTGASMLLHTLWALDSTDLGLDPHHVLSVSTEVFTRRYKPDESIRFYSEFLGRVSALPGVRSAALAFNSPLTTMHNFYPVERTGRHGQNPEAWQTIEGNVVSRDYFTTLRIPLLRGRDFRLEDNQQAPSVVIVNQILARTYWPNEDPIGRHLRIKGQSAPAEVIGVAGGVKQHDAWQAPEPFLYRPFAQSSFSQYYVLVRTRGDPMALVPAVRQQVAALDPQVPVYGASTLDQVAADSMAEPRMAASLVSLFGAFVLLLAVAGLYGVISYSVSQRTHEIGIRMALGARKNDVLKMVVGQGLKLVIIGVAIGIAGAFALTRFLSSLLYGVKPTDPVTFIIVSLALTAVAVLACYIPARRATKVDPMVALRHE